VHPLLLQTLFISTGASLHAPATAKQAGLTKGSKGNTNRTGAPHSFIILQHSIPNSPPSPLTLASLLQTFALFNQPSLSVLHMASCCIHCFCHMAIFKRSITTSVILHAP
jgi:hypothetical protein